MTSSQIAMLVTPIVIRGAQVYAQTAKAKRRNGSKVFTSPVILGVSFFGSACAIGIATAGVHFRESILLVMGLVWLTLSLWIWPTVIILDESGITANHIWRRSRKIPYAEIDAVSRTSNRTVTVYAKGKFPDIEIDNYHIAPDELESELRQRGVAYYDAATVYSSSV